MSALPAGTTVVYTFHGYATWMPDRPDGYYQNRSGWRAKDNERARQYEQRQQEEAVTFSASVQIAMIQCVLEAGRYQELTASSVATEGTHIHLLVGWSAEKHADQVQRRLKMSLTRHVNRQFERRALVLARWT